MCSSDLLARQVVQSQEEERAHLARELHDGVCQTLVSSKLMLETALDGAEAEVAAGVRHVALDALTRSTSPLDDLRAFRQVWRALRTERPDILHTHNPKPGVLGRIAGRLAGVPLVVNTQHGLYAQRSDRWRRQIGRAHV